MNKVVCIGKIERTNRKVIIFTKYDSNFINEYTGVRYSMKSSFKKITFAITVLLLFFSVSFSADFAVTVQRAWNTKNFHPIISSGILLKSNRVEVMYYEIGITALPRFSYSTATFDPLNSSIEKQFCFYGLYSGYYLSLIPLFRPGVVIGTVIEQKAHYQAGSKTPYKIDSPKVGLTAGLSVHILFLTVQLTNQGIGGGVNIKF